MLPLVVGGGACDFGEEQETAFVADQKRGGFVTLGVDPLEKVAPGVAKQIEDLVLFQDFDEQHPPRKLVATTGEHLASLEAYRDGYYMLSGWGPNGSFVSSGQWEVTRDGRMRLPNVDSYGNKAEAHIEFQPDLRIVFRRDQTVVQTYSLVARRTEIATSLVGNRLVPWEPHYVATGIAFALDENQRSEIRLEKAAKAFERRWDRTQVGGRFGGHWQAYLAYNSAQAHYQLGQYDKAYLSIGWVVANAANHRKAAAADLERAKTDPNYEQGLINVDRATMVARYTKSLERWDQFFQDAIKLQSDILAKLGGQ